MKHTIDLNELVLDKSIDEVKDMIKNDYGDEIGNDICSLLENKDLFEWIRVLNESENDVLDSKSFIGTKDLELESILNFKEVLKILSNSNNADWRDPSRFSVYVYFALADSIEKKFDSDREYIEYMENNTNQDVEKLSEVHNKLCDENNGELNIIDLFESEGDYQLKFSKLYSSVANMYSLTITDESEWDTNPNIGDYAVFSATKDDGTGGKILLKIKDIEVEELRYSDVSEEAVEDDFILDTRKNIVVENVANEDDVFEAYENHFLLKDPMERNKLKPIHNDNVTFHKENPLPF